VTFAYRYSVIPAGAVTDARLEPRDLQVLCLLGRHTNDNGWCRRSQVRMARELRCGRASLQRSIERLVEAGWLEKKLLGRDGIEPDPEKQPSSIYAYRVCLDNDDALAASGAADDETEDGEGVPTDGHPGAQPERAPPCPRMHGHHEPSPVEGSPQEPSERDARARPKAEKLLASLKSVWPTTAADDQDRIEREWQALPDDQQQAAVDRASQFLDELKRVKRSSVPALWNYLAQRRWTLLKEPEAPAPSPSAARCDVEGGTADWRAWDVYYRICGHGGIPSFRIRTENGKRIASMPAPLPPVGYGLDPNSANWERIVEGAGDGRFPAWLRKLLELPNVNIGVRSIVVDGKSRRTLTVPPTETGFPPAKSSTGPPEQQAAE
jgi:hypothetical protein